MKSLLTLTAIVIILVVLLKCKCANAKGMVLPHYFKEYGLTIKLLGIKKEKKPSKEDVGRYVFTLEITCDGQAPDVQTFGQVWPLDHPILKDRDGVHNMQRWMDYTIFIESMDPFKIRVKKDQSPATTNQNKENMTTLTGRIDGVTALNIAKNEVAKEKNHKFVIREDKTEEKNFGWIFYFATQEYIKTGDTKYLIKGSSSIAVEREGTTQLLGSMPPLHNETLKYLKNKWTAIDLAEKEIAKRQPDYFKDGGFLKQVRPLRDKNGEWFLMYNLPNTRDAQIEIQVDVSKGTILSYKNQWA